MDAVHLPQAHSFARGLETLRSGAHSLDVSIVGLQGEHSPKAFQY